MKTLLYATCLLFACQAVRAGAPSPSPAAKTGPSVSVTPASGSSAAATTEYVPKSKSVFIGSDKDHNPFWPIGWIKPAGSSSGQEGAPVIPHSDDFSVTTIMLNEPPMAVINGKDMAEGEVAAFTVNGKPVVVQLMAVQDGRVILRWQNQNLVIPIHRQEALTAVNPAP